MFIIQHQVLHSTKIEKRQTQVLPKIIELIIMLHKVTRKVTICNLVNLSGRTIFWNDTYRPPRHITTIIIVIVHIVTKTIMAFKTEKTQKHFIDITT